VVRFGIFITTAIFISLFQCLAVNPDIPTFEVNENKITRLYGSWNLVINKYLNYREVLNEAMAVPVPVPGSWNDVIWEGEKFSGIGYGTYYCKLKIPKSLHGQDLGIEFHDVALSYRVYTNNKLLGGVGKISKSVEEARPRLEGRFYKIQDVGEDLVIIVQVCNFSHENGGIWSVPRIGPYEMIKRAIDQRDTINQFIYGSIFIIGLYHLYLFFKRRKEMHNLYFFLICICLLAQSMTKISMPIVKLFPSIDWILLKKLEYLSVYTVAALNTLFVASIYSKFISNVFVTILKYISILAAFVTIFFHPGYSSYLLQPFQLIIFITGLYLIYVLLKAVISKAPDSVILLTGLSITFLTVVNDLLKVNKVIDSIWMVHYGMFIYIITLATVLARRFINALKQEELLSRRLETINRELEERVERRTAELASQKEIVAKKNKELQIINEEQRQLIAVVAHDLKSPLTKIIGIATILKKKIHDDLRNFVMLIEEVALEGNLLIDNLVNLRSVEREDYEFDSSGIEIGGLLNDRLAAFSNQAAAKSLKLVFVNDLPHKVLTIETDKQLLCRALDNLLSNAVKFSPAGKSIYLKIKQATDHIQIHVLDEGPGFTALDKGKVFGKFQKLSARPTGGEHSTGLGLSIVRAVTKKLGGSVDLVSSPGQGAEFIIKLPL